MNSYIFWRRGKQMMLQLVLKPKSWVTVFFFFFKWRFALEHSTFMIMETRKTSLILLYFRPKKRYVIIIFYHSVVHLPYVWKLTLSNIDKNTSFRVMLFECYNLILQHFSHINNILFYFDICVSQYLFIFILVYGVYIISIRWV